jgi:hypothetical protein
VSQAVDDFIRSSGNLAYVNTWLKLIVLLLFFVSLVLGSALTLKMIDTRTEHIVPIVINRATGDAVPVDYSIVDAAGEERAPVEIRKFAEDFLQDLYTYNRFTVKTALESVVKWTTPEALVQVKEAINLAHRSELIRRNAQGITEIRNFIITETRPLLKAQVYFQTKSVSPTNELMEEGQYLAVLTIKPIKRSLRSPHGLILIEYRQSFFKEGQ